MYSSDEPCLLGSACTFDWSLNIRVMLLLQKPGVYIIYGVKKVKLKKELRVEVRKTSSEVDKSGLDLERSKPNTNQIPYDQIICKKSKQTNLISCHIFLFPMDNNQLCFRKLVTLQLKMDDHLSLKGGKHR